MTSGREDIAEVSRVCRSIATRHAGLPADQEPSTDAVILGLLDEIQALAVPARTLQYMSAMVVAMYARLVRVARDRQASPLPIEDLLPSRGNPIRHKDCLAMIREVARNHRDEQTLADAVFRAGERWGVSANLALSFMFLSVALNVVAHDPSVSSLDALLAEFFMAEEIDLIDKGEA